MTKMSAASLTLILIGLLMHDIPITEACTHEPGYVDPTVLENVMNPWQLVLGTVKRQIYQDGSEYPWLYTAEVEIHCILRGSIVPRLINVTEAGQIPGWCENTFLYKGYTYIFGLNGVQAYGPSIEERDFAEAFQACALNPPTYPEGVDEATATYKCPAGLPYGECKTPEPSHNGWSTTPLY